MSKPDQDPELLKLQQEVKEDLAADETADPSAKKKIDNKIKESEEKYVSFIDRHKKALMIGGVVVVVMAILLFFSNRNIQVANPTLNDQEIEARIQTEVAQRIKADTAKIAVERNELINRVTRNFDCNAPGVFCHTQETTEPYQTVVSSLQSFQFVPDTSYEVYIEVFPLQVDQKEQRTGSICSPNNIHLFLCQKIVLKNPQQLSNQIRELYALLTPSMSYRMVVSGRPITSTDIDLVTISNEMDKITAEEEEEPIGPCVMPTEEEEPVALNLIKTGQMTCEEYMKKMRKFYLQQKEKEKLAQMEKEQGSASAAGIQSTEPNKAP